MWTNCGTVQSNYEEEESTTINITSFEELKSAVNVANENKGEYIFNVQKDFEISADEQVELSQSVVTLKGNGHSITVDTVADSYNPTEIYSSYVFVVKGEAKLNICTTDGNDSIKLLNTNNKERRYSDKQIRRISVASKKGVINIYKGTYSELGYAIAGKLNVYGGTFTNFDGLYLSKSGFRLTSVISTYSADKNESTAEVNIFGGTFEDNYARAINIEGKSKCSVKGENKDNPVIIKDNKTGYDGSGLMFNSASTLEVENALFENNYCGSEMAYRNRSQAGEGHDSAIHITGGTVTIKDSVFKGNHNSCTSFGQSGDICSTILMNGSNFSIDNSEISKNDVSAIGLINDAKGTIKNGVISNNLLSGIEMREGVNCNIKSTKIIKNAQTSSVACFGGGILSNAPICTDTTINCSKTNTINCDEDTVICNNKSREAGSDIYAKNTKLTLPEASSFKGKMDENDNDIDGWYYDGDYVRMGPSEGLERFGETNEPVLVELEPNEAKDYSIIAGYNYSQWRKVASHPADYYQRIYAAAEQTEVGVWKLNVYDTGDCSGSMSYCGDGKAFRDLKIRIDKPYTGAHRGKGSMYGLSAKAEFKVNDSTKEYNYTVVFKSNREGTADIGTSIRGVDVFKYDEKITVGENIITGTFFPDSWEYGGFVFCPIDLPEGTIIDFTEFIIEEVSSQKDAPSGFACKEVDDNVTISWLDYNQVNLYVDNKYYGTYNGGNILLPKDDLGYGEHTFEIAGITDDPYGESKRTESIKLEITIKQPTDFSAYNFVDNNGTYKLKFKPGDEDVDTYELSVDDEKNKVTTFSTKGLKLDEIGFYTVEVNASVLEKYAKEIEQNVYHSRLVCTKSILGDS